MAVSSKDIGVKISNIGWDVKTAGDANLYFSSSWPLLKIEATDMSTTGAVINHGLQYPPLAFAWTPTDGLSTCAVNSSTMTIPSAPSITTSCRYFIFRVPLNVAYQSPVVHAPLTQPGTADHNFGLKFVKRGKDLGSNDLRDFTLHSSARSPILHAVLAQKIGQIGEGDFSAVNGIKWTPDLPYRPVYFGFYSSNGENYVPADNLAQVPPKISYDRDKGIVLNAASLTGYGSLVILKDPFDFLPRTTVNL